MTSATVPASGLDGLAFERLGRQRAPVGCIVAGHGVRERRGHMSFGTAHVWIRSGDNELIRSDVIAALRCRGGEVEADRADGGALRLAGPWLPAGFPRGVASRAGVSESLAR